MLSPHSSGHSISNDCGVKFSNHPPSGRNRMICPYSAIPASLTEAPPCLGNTASVLSGMGFPCHSTLVTVITFCSLSMAVVNLLSIDSPRLLAQGFTVASLATGKCTLSPTSRALIWGATGLLITFFSIFLKIYKVSWLIILIFVAEFLFNLRPI